MTAKIDYAKRRAARIETDGKRLATKLERATTNDQAVRAMDRTIASVSKQLYGLVNLRDRIAG